MTDHPLAEPELPPSLRFLKHLVTVLMIVMIVGVITVVGLLVTRMPSAPIGPVLPDALALPAGAKAAAVTMGTGWIAVVTTDDRILIYDTTGNLRQELQIDVTKP
jgi:hypothetical protein